MAYTYTGPEILTELIFNEGVKGKGKIKQSQTIIVKCTRCEKCSSVNYYGHVKNRLRSPFPEYLCRSCISSITTSERNKARRGKTIEDLLGEDRGKEFREDKREYAIKNNIGKYFKSPLGLTWVDQYGKDKADAMKDHHRSICKLKPLYGADNYQFGKPSHNLSGRGVKGYYKGIFFRSIMELSFIVNFIERENLEYESGELKKHRFTYMYNNRQRNYFCDYVIGNMYCEIKPIYLHTHPQNIAKWKSARRWCESNGKLFRVFCEQDYDQLTKSDIDLLKNEGKLII